jgi:hypothetical protein
MWWCKVIAQHGFIFLLLLATSQIWYKMADAVVAVKDAVIQPGISIASKVMVKLCRIVRAYVEPVVVAVVKMTTAVVNVTMRASMTTVNWVRVLLWKMMWRRTSLLLSLTYMHDEVWLPFLLSMALVIVITGLVYLPHDTGSIYVPKRRRKWSRYWKTAIRELGRKLAATPPARWVKTRWDEVSKRGQRPPMLRTTLISTTARAILPGLKRVCQVSRRVCRVQRRASRADKKVVNKIVTSNRLPSLLRWIEIISLVIEFSKMNHDNGTAASRTAASCARWVAIAVNMFESTVRERIEHCKITWAIICIYAVMFIWKSLQNYLLCSPCKIKAITNSKEEPVQSSNNSESVDEDGEEYFDCVQGFDHCHGEQEEAEVDVTVMPAATAAKHLNDSQRDLGYDSDAYWMAVDNCCSSCITNCLSDFVGPTKKVLTRVKGIRGVHVIATMKGVL